LVYEQYVLLAKHKNWEIKDPVMKLQQTSTTFCKVAMDSYLDSTNDEKLGFEEALKSEISMLIGILRRSKHKKIDITHITFDVLESINQCYYQYSKKYLANNST
jgi:hypothetical protein